MALNQCSLCDAWFHEDAEGGCLCPDCQKVAEEKWLKKIKEIYEIQPLRKEETHGS